MANKTLPQILILSTLVALSACAPGQVSGDDPGGGAGQGGGAGPAGAGSNGADAGPGGGGSGGNGAGGEACAEIGASRECSPAPCRRGTQVCEPGSATASGGTWGPCKDVKDVAGCMPPDAPCDCTKPTPACEDYCKGRDGGPPPPPTGCGDPKCPPGAVRLCDVMQCGGPGVQVCLADETWSVCRAGRCDPFKPGGPCNSHLDCPRHQLCRGPDYTLTGEEYAKGPNQCVLQYPSEKEMKALGLPVIFDSRWHCDVDSECDYPCKSEKACKCHPHGICINECLVNAECPAGKVCHTIPGFCTSVLPGPPKGCPSSPKPGCKA